MKVLVSFNFLFFICLLQKIVLSQDKLLLVIEHFRHGARGPLKNSYDYQQQTYMAGELTDVGIFQQYQLGSQIRAEYIQNRQFLRPYFNHTEILVYSTDVNRTIMSAYAHLTALYPPGTGYNISVTNQTLLQTPYQNAIYYPIAGGYALPYGMSVFPVHTLPQQGSILPHYCPNYNLLIQANIKQYGDFISNLNAVCNDLYQEVADMINEPINNLQDLMNFEDVMTADIYQQRKLPPQLTYDQINKINILRAISWFVYQTGPVAKALASNGFNFIIQQFKNKINNNSTLKYIVLSGHDSTLSRQILQLNMSNHECQWQRYLNKPSQSLNCVDSPRFGSTIIYELYQSAADPTQNYVMVKYNNQYVYLCEKQSTKCELQEFISRLQYSSGVYEDLCGIISDKNIIDDRETLIQFLAIITVILAIVTALLGYSLYKIKQQSKSQIQYLQEHQLQSPLYNQSDMSRYVELHNMQHNQQQINQPQQFQQQNQQEQQQYTEQGYTQA
ncbi:hypothetical protein ABPG74_013832 [Tetrahymena malaccensis]